MSKRRIAIAILVIILTAVGVFLAQQLAWRSVTVEIEADDYSAGLFSGPSVDDKVITTFTGGLTTKLRDGYYCVVLTSEKYTADESCFVVYKEDRAVNITPALSTSYLGGLLTSSEQAAISAALSSTYADVLSGFTMDEGRLVLDGTWYIGSLTQKTASRSEQGDTYRYIMQKVDGNWQIAAKPELVISIANHPDIPEVVIRAANDL